MGMHFFFFCVFLVFFGVFGVFDFFAGASTRLLFEEKNGPKTFCALTLRMSNV